MRSLAVAPATKYSQPATLAIGSSTRRTRMTDGSTGLLGGMECGGNSLLIDHPRCFSIPTVVCGQEIRVGKQRRNDIWESCFCVEIPERVQNLDVARGIGAHPPGGNQLDDGFAGIDREFCGLEISRQLFRGRFTSPVGILRQIDLLKTLDVGLKSLRVEF